MPRRRETGGRASTEPVERGFVSSFNVYPVAQAYAYTYLPLAFFWDTDTHRGILSMMT